MVYAVMNNPSQIRPRFEQEKVRLTQWTGLTRRARWLLLWLLLLLSALTKAQTYPTKPLRLVVPFPPGGALDFVARFSASKLSSSLAQPIVIDNRPGAGGNIGIEWAAKAPADGYTLLAASSFYTINPSFYAHVNYDPIKDFEPISLLSSYMLFLVIHPSLPFRSVKDLITFAKQHQYELNYASAGVGTTTHIAAELFSYMSGARMTHIPYKGSGMTMPASISGQVAIQFSSPAAIPFVQSGKLVLLAVTSSKRSVSFPKIPTISEAALPGYEATAWNALFTPSGTPNAIVRRINEDINKGLSQPDAINLYAKQGFEINNSSPEALATLIKIEVVKWSKVINAAGIKAE